MSEANQNMLPLGDPETAVVSLVNLISTATGANEQKLAYWLDAYYQARLAYEKANAPEPDPTILRRGDLEPVIRQLWEETLHKSSRKEASKRLANRKAEKTKGEVLPISWKVMRVEDLDDTDLSASDLLGLPPTADEPAVSPAAAAAAFKRQQKERLEELRGLGLHIAQIEEASDGALTDHQILSILEGNKQPVAIYRVLCNTLDKLEPLFRGRSDE